MTDPFDSLDKPPVIEPDPIVIADEVLTIPQYESRSHLFSYAFTWCVIFVVLLFHLVGKSVAPIETRLEATKADLLQVSMAAKIQVGARKLAGTGDMPNQLSKFDADDFPETHWGEAILLNEVRNADAALSHLKSIQRSMGELDLTLTPDQQRLSKILTLLFSDYEQGDMSASSVPESDRTFLKGRFGWLGTLALTPKNGADPSARASLEQSALTFMIIMLIIAMLFVLMLLAGMVGLGFVLVGVVTKRLSYRFENQTGHGHLYGETFAVWFVLFTALQLVVGTFVPAELHLAGAGVAFFTSLIALLWPVVRGASWAEAKKAIGWRCRTNPLFEVLCGVGAYICMVPLILAAAFVSYLLMQVLSAGGLASLVQMDGKNSPSHPIIHELVKSDPIILITTLILACVAAPIIEETMFRGVLYRHMRDSTVWLPRLASVAVSAGLNSLIFAAIHPQGLVGIPVLTTIAFGFSLVREWRDSLIAPMVMHAMNNGMVTVMFIVIVSNL